MTALCADRTHNGPEIAKDAGPNQVQVDDAHCFSGLDGYKHVIESADVVLIACSAKYHPVYMRAAIEAGKHVFVEKPHAIDPVGVREVTAACELAKQKGLSVMSGLMSRYDPGYREAVQRIHDGAIGEIVALRTFSAAALPALLQRQPNMNEVEYQFSNQYHFTWLSGDDVPQSLIHNLDRADWVMRGRRPCRRTAWAAARPRSARSTATSSTTTRWSTIMRTGCGCSRAAAPKTAAMMSTSTIYYGTKGRCDLCRYRIEGQTNWSYRGRHNYGHDLEQKALLTAIRSGNPINCGDYMARSTLVTVMGQLACYSGKEMTWEQMSKSNFVFTPTVDEVRLDMEPPVKPDAQGWYPVPMPGLTEFKI